MNKKKRKLKKKVKIVVVIITVLLGVLAWNSYSKKSEMAMEAKETSMRIKVENEAIEKKELAAKKALEKEEKSAARKKLTDDMNKLDSEYEGTIGFILLDKDTNEQVEVNPDHIFTSASLYKLYVTYAVLTEVDKGNLTLDTVMNSQSGETVGDYLHDTITWSANPTSIALADKLGWDAIQNLAQQSGFTETTFNAHMENGVAQRGPLQTTPANVADLLNRLMDGKLLSKESTEYFMGLLDAQTLIYALNTGLSSEVNFAHKTGILDDVSHDAGIITDQNGKKHVVVVMSDGWTNADEQATPMFIRSGEAIMDYLSN